jgi:hypothetical protein
MEKEIVMAELEGTALKKALAKAKIAGIKGTTTKTVAAKGVATGKASIATKGAAATGSAAKAATGGTIWTGKSLSLGLGLGLGAWGPVMLVGAGAAAWYAYKKYFNTADIDAPTI